MLAVKIEQLESILSLHTNTIEELKSKILILESNNAATISDENTPIGQNSSDKKTKKSKKLKVEKDDDTPKQKRPKTGYLVFSQANREEVKTHLSANCQIEDKVNPKDVTRELAIRWKALTSEEQSVWNTKAKEEHSATLTID
tara:strand:- start:148 stop:576 length:429 start_codon:yes stop_codon:yes gene_type:complete